MLERQSPEEGLFDPDNTYLDFVGQDTFYSFLALNGGSLPARPPTPRTFSAEEWRRTAIPFVPSDTVRGD